MLNGQLLESFINGFYGFGKYEASYWFIGMEEGGADTAEKIARQLELWDRWGRKELLDVAEYAREMNITRWYGDSPKLQPTWKHLMRVALTAEGRPSDRETMRKYQTTEWGTKAGNVCIVELLPLPAPSISSWLYRDISKLPYLAGRKTYREHVVSSRIAHLRQRIDEHQPKAVVLYGSGYDEYWKRIAGVDDWDTSAGGVRFATAGSTLFVPSKHPVAHGATNDYFEDIGRLIASYESCY
jgi:hypothetical protein